MRPPKSQKRTVLLDTHEMMRAVAMARFRLTNLEIERRLGLTGSQTSYRLHLYKVRTGMEESVRQRASHGNDPIIEQAMADYFSVMEADFKKQFMPTVIPPVSHTKNK